MHAFGLIGTGEPLEGSTWTLNGGDSAANQDVTQSFVATSGILPPDELSRSSRAGRRRAGIVRADPSSRTPDTQYVYSQIADVSYKRLTREIAVPAGGGSAVLLDVVRH